MIPEEIAILRILYKHYDPIKLSTLIEGFPDHSRSFIVNAISRLQLQSYLVLIDTPLELYVSITRQKRRIVLDLLESDSRQHNFDRLIENEMLKSPSVRVMERDDDDDDDDSPRNSNTNNEDLLLRLPKRAVKIGLTLLVFSFVVTGSVSILNSQIIGGGNAITGGNENTLPSILFSSLPTTNENEHRAKTTPIGQVYESGQTSEAYSGEPSIYKGIFTKFGSKSSSGSVPPMSYYYIFSEKHGLVYLEPLVPVSAISESNSSLSSIIDNQGKQVSST
jgi:hypothetical protein